ncbi:MAG TPA: bifunctional phosphopantothenoylcysteine decarboxylase/phosphopantothenate--cysteine ligase CoaBC [Blastocatellia bacterium]|jgi:phosphopantothenoylcysteine decarboxylase/phosphopantothenate--cysteine ligase|nr:bifunctional phosphopantothenoylcysteine decarboxylase/phosphopantothenate--cysteine ligase CoaBC [Blastocatellia bacterium]
MKVLLGVTGCVGAYKAAEILRGLQRQGVQIRVVMTRHATEFVRPLTFEALSGQPVIVEMFDRPNYATIEHISVAREADLLLVAPATANTMAKFAHGIADDFLSTVYLSNTNPVLIAPAMNVEMWNHSATRANIEILRDRGVLFVAPGVGYQACGEVGMGRLAEPEEIVERALEILKSRISDLKFRDFAGEGVMVTAGPTIEDLDPVRFIANRSSGRMGYALAEAARDRGARVTLISGPVNLAPPENVEVVNVRSTHEMFEAVMSRIQDVTVFIGSAAVADFRPARLSEQKIKKEGRKTITLELEETEDIIAAVGAAPDRERRIVAGFAAESQSLLEYAGRKLREKGLDLIVANDITRAGAGFGVETNAATILKRDGSRVELPLQSKRALADRALDEIAELRRSAG